MGEGCRLKWSSAMSNYDKIAQRAYQLWEKEGRPKGKETEHWLRAEAEIKREEQRQGSRTGSSMEEADVRRNRRVFAS
jgi:hypothetical protein